MIKRGQFPTSLSSLSSELDLSVNIIRTAIAHLVSTGEITSKSQGKYRIITVNNYDLYQGLNKVEHREITGKPQGINKEITTLEEKKEINNISVSDNTRMEPCTRFDEFWNLYPKKINRFLAEQEYAGMLATTAGLGEEQLLAAAKNYAEACQIKKTREQYIKNPENWLRDSSWIDYLPQNYQRPAKADTGNSGSNKNKFNNFPQRNYNYDELEKQLLGVKKE